MTDSASQVGAVIPAAGMGTRMGLANKIFAQLAGRPLLVWVLDVFQGCPSIDKVVVVLSGDELERCWKLAREYGWSKVEAVCQGGVRRQDSVREGLKRLSGCDWVVIHDGARPCVTDNLIERGLIEARDTGAAIAAVPVKDTIKIIGSGSLVEETPKRRNLWAVQTPQVFRLDIISKAYREGGNEVTDDAMLVEKMGYRVKVYMGSYENIKVTTPDDLLLAELILKNRLSGTNTR